MRQKTKKRIIAWDFDGVISTYKGWKGFNVFGAPIRKTINVMKKLKRQGYFITIFTTRLDTPKLRRWLDIFQVPYHSINSTAHNPPHTSFKPLFHCIVDDRAVNPVELTEKELETQIKQKIKEANSYYKEK